MTEGRVTKAVIPAAGLGSRFLPATKAIPKEMVPLVDRPAIQHVVEEAVAAGIDDILIVTGPTKRAIEDHFDRALDLERELDERGKHAVADRVRRASSLAHIHTVRQGAPLGLGHAVGAARHHVGSEAFVVMLPDDIVAPPTSVVPGMLDAFRARRRPVVALRRVIGEQISAYGCAAVERLEDAEGDEGPEGVGGALVRITHIVEKPALVDAPSDLAVFGRYVFGPEVFDAIDDVQPGAGGEIQLTDAIALLAKQGDVHGWAFDGTTYDTGTPLGFLEAATALGLADPEIGPSLAAHVRRLLDP